jgi:hypothetical protein
MPGSSNDNPWADELKKSRRRSRASFTKGAGNVSSADEQVLTCPDLSSQKTTTNLAETKEMTFDDKKKTNCVKEQSQGQSKQGKIRPVIKPAQPAPADLPKLPKVKPPDLPVSSGLYQGARSQLRPVARMLSRQMSKESAMKSEIFEEDVDGLETPVDRLIRQGSIEAGATSAATPKMPKKEANNKVKEVKGRQNIFLEAGALK